MYSVRNPGQMRLKSGTKIQLEMFCDFFECKTFRNHNTNQMLTFITGRKKDRHLHHSRRRIR